MMSDMQTNHCQDHVESTRFWEAPTEINEFKDRRAAGTLSRRDISKAMAAVGLATVAYPVTGGKAAA
ncbi:MAG: hypothetical protein CMM46_09825 [Rhodospirillaceae bacterium]|nr:hypothetical protein [Rhodospirillaceae bacterium]|tara:strand:+ start:2698 stop:2898 length:201 start_codon:yes stop_codon:yes gene_type:complete